jgi:hypothetical protein
LPPATSQVALLMGRTQLVVVLIVFLYNDTPLKMLNSVEISRVIYILQLLQPTFNKTAAPPATFCPKILPLLLHLLVDKRKVF